MEDKSIHILLVEDNKLDACLVQDMLIEEDAFPFNLTHVMRLDEALRYLEKNSVDAILLDLFLPDAEGLSTVTALRDVALEVPIVVLTGFTDKELALQSLQHGAQDYLIKGQVDAQFLTSAIRHAVERKRLELKFRHLAESYDALTGLPNRVLFYDRLNQAIAQARRTNTLLALLCLDIDDFKSINETLGHALGDKLLAEVAKRLTECLRASDSIARLGGDEFAFMALLPDSARGEDAGIAAQRIFDTLKRPFLIDKQELFVSTSIGASVFPMDGDNAETLLKNADTAVHRAKREGREKFRLYSKSMNIKASARLAMGNALRRALEREELLLHYQPQIDLRSRRISGVEALMRWRHPEWGFVSPSQFIPLAEETDLIVPLGEWALHQACAQNKRWQNDGLPCVPVAVNLSSRQIKRNTLPDTVTRVLRETGLEPKFLELELTESGLMETGDSVTSILRRLKETGVRISIDDFGTGYSSLSYLKSFPIDTLKIDQSFIRDIIANKDDAAIVNSIITMAHNLRLDVIAEGVETIEQVIFLREIGCDHMQGHYFCRAQSAEDFGPILKEQPQWKIAVGTGEGP